MSKYLRRSSIRCVVALGLGLSAAAPAQPVVVPAAPVLPVQIDDNGWSQESIPSDQAIETPAVASYETVGSGRASYYGSELAGHRTASGERFNPGDLTAAHRSLPIGTKLRVTNLANGMTVVVRVNDRGPVARSRILDMSMAAARRIAMIRSGTARVKLELIRYG